MAARGMEEGEDSEGARYARPREWQSRTPRGAADNLAVPRECPPSPAVSRGGSGGRAQCLARNWRALRLAAAHQGAWDAREGRWRAPAVSIRRLCLATRLTGIGATASRIRSGPDRRDCPARTRAARWTL